VREADSREEILGTLGQHGGYVKAPWCGDEECEAPIKEPLAAEIVMCPFDDAEPIGDAADHAMTPTRRVRSVTTPRPRPPSSRKTIESRGPITGAVDTDTAHCCRYMRRLAFYSVIYTLSVEQSKCPAVG
ncbi:MAG: prolyl-tRNA synthetase, partial [Halonotius sp. J07HN6]